VRAAAPLLLAAAGTAQAGPPLNTDDAGILSPGACQLELRVRGGQHVQQQYAQPSCNPGGAVEWALNLTHARADDGPVQTLLGVQGKTALLAGDGWGAAASLALVQELRRGEPATTGVLNLIASVAPSSASALHLNLGAMQARGGRAVATWAAAAEYSLGERWTLLGERYGERHGRPATQIGARTWLQPNVLQLDATLGHEHAGGRSERYATLGLVWVWDGVFAARRP
jgi:hypothetical protein